MFKGKPEKNNEKKNSIDVVKNKRIFIFFQDNGWINDYIFMKWVDNIYLPYQNKIIKKYLFLFDRALSILQK